MKGAALVMALGKPKGMSDEAGGDTGDIHAQAKADLATALKEMASASDPQAKAEAFISALELADECRSYAPKTEDEA